MNLFSHLSVAELSPLLQLVQRSHYIRRHVELLNWLQEDIQQFLPHGIVIAAWGDLSLGVFCYDVVSPLPGVRTDALDEAAIYPFLSSLFNRWQVSNYRPFVLNANHGFAPDGICNLAMLDAMQHMRSALVHGIKDQRGRHNCLYVVLGPSELSSTRSKEIFRFLLPFIDTAFRQIVPLPEQYLAIPSPGEPQLKTTEPLIKDTNRFNLSAREMDIMAWVRAGKTNLEIGLILSISIFTVKNHLQRIFKKLDVFNRAQAVAKLEPSAQYE